MEVHYPQIHDCVIIAGAINTFISPDHDTKDVLVYVLAQSRLYTILQTSMIWENTCCNG